MCVCVCVAMNEQIFFVHFIFPREYFARPMYCRNEVNNHKFEDLCLNLFAKGLEKRDRDAN